ncbi:MAG: tetratricopeptide repeat protein [Pikeienuella sp.]
MKTLTMIISVACILVACAPRLDEGETGKADEVAGVLDAVDLNDLMLTVSDPDEAVNYFADATSRHPERLDLKRSYALSLARAGKFLTAARVFEELSTTEVADDVLRVEYAHTLARLDRWAEANVHMSLVSAGYENARRYLIVGMLADNAGDWGRSDRAYERAQLLSANPASVLNNWGVSRLSRGDYVNARRTFEEAIAYDPNLFNAKNNLAVSRALEGEYRLPVVTVSEEERAILLHNIGVIALRRGDVTAAKGLFTLAVEAHPRHYAAAAGKLAALESEVAE